MNVSSFVKAGYPVLYLVTQEADRATKAIHAEGWSVYSWDCLRGITAPDTGQVMEDILDPLQALSWLAAKGNTILCVQNYHHFMGSVEIIQGIMNMLAVYKSQGSCLVMVGPFVKLPPEIDKYITLLDFSLPSPDDIRRIMHELGESVGVEVSEEAVEAACGLTEFEAETAMALSLVQEKRFCPDIITTQKKMMIRRSGLMEFWPPVPISMVGGLERFKAYITNRMVAFEPGNEHLPKPKAILLVGIPGTGKSLSCKAAASLLGWPLIRLDVSSLKGSLVGESEKRMRQACSTIDAFGKAVVWLDELEKGFAGVRSSGATDGGTTASMFGQFLTWMQETTAPILVMATANDISALPPEFMRAGRFDAMFFVDIPTTEERRDIIGIMNARYTAQIPLDMAEELEGWSGAEIEQLAKDSLFDGLEAAKDSIVPLSRTMKEQIQALRDWARTRARRANADETTTLPKVRRIQ